MADVNPKYPLIQFPFSAGIDESTNDAVVEAGAGWLVLENGRQDQRGGYSTRNGYAALQNTRVDTTSATAGYRVFADARSPVRISDLMQVETWSTSTNRWRQAPGRVCGEADYQTIEIPSLSASATPEDVEYCNGYLAIVVQGASNASLMVLDAGTLAQATASGTVGASTVAPMLASYSGRYIALLAITSTTINVSFLDTSTALGIQIGFTSNVLVANDKSNTRVANVSVCSLSDRIAVAYVNSGGTTDRVTVKTVTVAGVVDTATVNTNSVVPPEVALGCYAGTGTLFVGWSEGVLVRLKGLTYNSLSTVLATSATAMTMATNPLLIHVSPSSSTAGRVIANETTGTIVQMRGFTTSAGAISVPGAQTTATNTSVCSRPFTYGGRHYVQVYGAGTDNVLATGNEQKNLLLVDWTDDNAFLRPVVNLTPELAINGLYGKCKTVAGALATTFYGLAGVQRSGRANSCTLIEYDFASGRRWQAVAHGNSTFLSGGVLGYFDGTRCTEAGFMYRPTIPLNTATGAAGTLNGDYRYIAVYEDVDADGNWYISGLSDPSAKVTVVNKISITMTTSPLTVTQRTNSNATSTTPTIAWYRTGPTGVAPYYRTGTSFNNPGSTTVSIIDTRLDTAPGATSLPTDLQAQAKLYAQPDVVGTSQDHRPPPGLAVLTSYNGMLVGATGSDVWYSGQNVSGEGTWFNPVFQVPVPGQGEVTALAVMDGTLYVFKRSEVYAIVGEAPSDNGAAGGLGLPRRLACDVGCIESRSVCTTALGIFFQSDRGIEIITRAQTVEWIGEAVQVTVATYPICTSAVVDPASNTVLLEMASAQSAGLVTGTGRALIYDLSLRTWVSTDRRHSVSGTVDCPSQSACITYTGSAYRYVWIAADGTVHAESRTTNLDADGTFVAKRAVSANVKGGGLQGMQQVNRTLVLAKRVTDHDLTMSLAYDYNSSYVNPRTWTAAELSAITLPNQQLEHTMGDDSTCEAVRAQLLEITPSSGTLGIGAGATWVSLCFEVVPRSGAFLLPDTSR